MNTAVAAAQTFAARLCGLADSNVLCMGAKGRGGQGCTAHHNQLHALILPTWPDPTLPRPVCSHRPPAREFGSLTPLTPLPAPNALDTALAGQGMERVGTAGDGDCFLHAIYMNVLGTRGVAATPEVRRAPPRPPLCLGRTCLSTLCSPTCMRVSHVWQISVCMGAVHGCRAWMSCMCSHVCVCMHACRCCASCASPASTRGAR